ncbi:toxin VasX, partial [Marinobacter sp. 1Y8]
MSRKQRPADDRESGILKAFEETDVPEEEGVSCPILTKVTLLPLRYGRVESLVPGLSPPYELKSRPLGIRMIRDGFIYVLDEADHALHEYEHSDGVISGHNGGRLDYDKTHTLYVCFSDIAWT